MRSNELTMFVPQQPRPPSRAACDRQKRYVFWIDGLLYLSHTGCFISTDFVPSRPNASITDAQILNAEAGKDADVGPTQDAGFIEDADAGDAGNNDCLENLSIALCPLAPKTTDDLYVNFVANCADPTPPPSHCTYEYRWLEWTCPEFVDT